MTKSDTQSCPVCRSKYDGSKCKKCGYAPTLCPCCGQAVCGLSNTDEAELEHVVALNPCKCMVAYGIGNASDAECLWMDNQFAGFCRSQVDAHYADISDDAFEAMNDEATKKEEYYNNVQLLEMILPSGEWLHIVQFCTVKGMLQEIIEFPMVMFFVSPDDRSRLAPTNDEGPSPGS